MNLFLLAITILSKGRSCVDGFTGFALCTPAFAPATHRGQQLAALAHGDAAVQRNGAYVAGPASRDSQEVCYSKETI